MATLAQIDEFLGLKRLAVVGVSRNPRDFTRSLFKDLARRGYDLVPVNPEAPEIEGRRCYARVADIQPPVEGALLLTAPVITQRVAQECQSAGIDHLWIYRDIAVPDCEAAGTSVVAGECPFMYLPRSGFIHGFHGFCRKLAGTYPK